MLAARMYGIHDLRIEEMPKPKIGAGEILVKVRAAAICGTDVRMLTSGAKGTDSSQPLVPVSYTHLHRAFPPALPGFFE